MDRRGFDKVVPTPGGAVPIRQGSLDLTAGYIERALDSLPKQGSKPPWRIRQNYVLDLLVMRFGNPRASLRFSPRRGSRRWRNQSP